MDPYSPIDYQIALLRSDYRSRTALPIELQANLLLDYSLYPSFYPSPYLTPFIEPYPVCRLGYRRPAPYFFGGYPRCYW